MSCLTGTVGVTAAKETESEAFVSGIVKFWALCLVGCSIWCNGVAIVLEVHFEVLWLSVMAGTFQTGTVVLGLRALDWVFVSSGLIQEFHDCQGDVDTGGAAQYPVTDVLPDESFVKDT